MLMTDKVFGPQATTVEVYDVAAKPVVKAAMEGVTGKEVRLRYQLKWTCASNIACGEVSETVLATWQVPFSLTVLQAVERHIQCM